MQGAVIAATTSAPSNTTGYDCVGTTTMPFNGAEVLVVGCFFLCFIAVYCSVFIDVAIKQLMPSKFLDKVVMARVAKIQQDFPKIVPQNQTPLVLKEPQQEEEKGTNEEEWDPIVKQELQSGRVTEEGKELLASLEYDQIVCMDPYIATCSVDEDLSIILANGNAFSTVSSYCSCTVRGYAMLSTMLLIAGLALGFMWCQNALVNPVGDDWTRYLSLVGYCLCFCTGIVMCHPNGKAVMRDRNILLWTSIPTSSKLFFLHGFGIVCFCLLPLLAHLLQVIFRPYEHNRATNWTLVTWQILGALCFVLPEGLQKLKIIDGLMANKLGICGECVAVMVSMIAFVEKEIYATAACAQMEGFFHTLMLVSIFGPLAFLVKRTFAGSPTAPFTNQPSVLLLNNGTPIASSGPCPVFNYDNKVSSIPNIPVS